MKILACGALLVDQIARVERFPGVDDEVFVPKLEMLPGGSAANFAVLCSRLGFEVGFMGKVGKDSFGEFLVRDLIKEGVDIDGILHSDTPTGTVFVAVNPKGERTMFAYSGAANGLDKTELSYQYMVKYSHLHMADLENILFLEFLAKKFHGTISLGAGALIAEKGPKAKDLIGNVNILICSQDEALKLSNRTELKEALTKLKSLGPELIVVTMGEDGSLAFNGERIYRQDAIRVNVVDTTGAGDSFSAGFLFKYLQTKDIQQSLLYGNAAAAVTIQEFGARTALKGIEQIKKVLGEM
ncbi:MAG: carbohydrate kinase family protein [Candidatus Altiarchaeota archaeon]|nr:carbohydrate kinase family protein [Candidatus Altiarchaeota archaeon]